MHRNTPKAKLHQLLEEERKEKLEIKNELSKTKAELERKARLLSRYKNFTNLASLAVTEAKNNTVLPVLLNREDELRRQLEFNIKRIKDCEKTISGLTTANKKLSDSNQDAENNSINQNFLIKQLQALNEEKSEEIKQFQKTVTGTKAKKDSDSTVNSRYITALKNALLFGDLLIQKNVPLPKKKKLWMSNAQIWLQQLGETKFNIKLYNVTENLNCGIDNENSFLDDNEEYDSANETMSTVIQSNKIGEYEHNSITALKAGGPSSPDEGLGLSPQLSIISQLSNNSDTRTIISSVSSDSGISVSDNRFNSGKRSKNKFSNPFLNIDSNEIPFVEESLGSASDATFEFTSQIIDNSFPESEREPLKTRSTNASLSLPSIFDPETISGIRITNNRSLENSAVETDSNNRDPSSSSKINALVKCNDSQIQYSQDVCTTENIEDVGSATCKSAPENSNSANVSVKNTCDLDTLDNSEAFINNISNNINFDQCDKANELSACDVSTENVDELPAVATANVFKDPSCREPNEPDTQIVSTLNSSCKANELGTEFCRSNSSVTDCDILKPLNTFNNNENEIDVPLPLVPSEFPSGSVFVSCLDEEICEIEVETTEILVNENEVNICDPGQNISATVSRESLSFPENENSCIDNTYNIASDKSPIRKDTFLEDCVSNKLVTSCTADNLDVGLCRTNSQERVEVVNNKNVIEPVCMGMTELSNIGKVQLDSVNKITEVSNLCSSPQSVTSTTRSSVDNCVLMQCGSHLEGLGNTSSAEEHMELVSTTLNNNSVNDIIVSPTTAISNEDVAINVPDNTSCSTPVIPESHSQDIFNEDDEMTELLSEIKRVTSVNILRVISPISKFKGKRPIIKSEIKTSNSIVKIMPVKAEERLPRKTEVVQNDLAKQGTLQDPSLISTSNKDNDEFLENIFKDVVCPSPVSLISSDSNFSFSDCFHNNLSENNLDNCNSKSSTSQDNITVKNQCDCKNENFSMDSFRNEMISFANKKINDRFSDCRLLLQNELMVTIRKEIENKFKSSSNFVDLRSEETGIKENTNKEKISLDKSRTESAKSIELLSSNLKVEATHEKLDVCKLNKNKGKSDTHKLTDPVNNISVRRSTRLHLKAAKTEEKSDVKKKKNLIKAFTKKKRVEDVNGSVVNVGQVPVIKIIPKRSAKTPEKIDEVCKEIPNKKTKSDTGLIRPARRPVKNKCSKPHKNCSFCSTKPVFDISSKDKTPVVTRNTESDKKCNNSCINGRSQGEKESINEPITRYCESSNKCIPKDGNVLDGVVVSNLEMKVLPLHTKSSAELSLKSYNKNKRNSNSINPVTDSLNTIETTQSKTPAEKHSEDMFITKSCSDHQTLIDLNKLKFPSTIKTPLDTKVHYARNLEVALPNAEITPDHDEIGICKSSTSLKFTSCQPIKSKGNFELKDFRIDHGKRSKILNLAQEWIGKMHKGNNENEVCEKTQKSTCVLLPSSTMLSTSKEPLTISKENERFPKSLVLEKENQLVLQNYIKGDSQKSASILPEPSYIQMLKCHNSVNIEDNSRDKKQLCDSAAENLISESVTSDIPVFNFYTNISENSNNDSGKRKLADDENGSSCKRTRNSVQSSKMKIPDIFFNVVLTDRKNNSRPEKIYCRNVIATAFKHHKQALMQGNSEEMESKDNGFGRKIAEEIIVAIQELCNNKLPLTATKLNASVTGLKTCSKKSVAEKIISALCDDSSKIIENPSRTPPLSSLQRYLFPVAYLLCRDPDYPEFLLTFLSLIKLALFNESVKCMVTPSQNLTRFTTVLSRSLYAFEEMRWFIYDVLYMLRFKAIPILYMVMSIWPSLIPSSSIAKDCPLSFCISHVILDTTIETKNRQLYKLYELKQFMKQRYGYKLGNMTSDQAFFKLLTMISKNGFVEAVVLLCKRKGLEWTLNKVSSALLPVFESWRKGEVDDSVIAIIVSLIGYLLRPFPSQLAGQVTQQVLTEFEKLLCDSKVPTIVQEAAVISLCRLSRSNFELCVDILYKWKPKNKMVSKNVIINMKYFIAKKKPVWWQSTLASLVQNECLS